MKKQIEVSVDVFAALWSIRLPEESSEDEILSRLLKLKKPKPHFSQNSVEISKEDDTNVKNNFRLPKSKKWTELLIWTLHQLGGQATLTQIYSKSREGRIGLGCSITREHDASARECLESHCKESDKYREKADLFYMPKGKGAGIWALREQYMNTGLPIGTPQM